MGRPRSPIAGPPAEPREPPSPEPTGSGQGQRATSRRPSQPSPHPSPSTPHTTHSSFTLAVCMTSPPAPALPSTTACWPSATATTTGSSRTPGAPDGASLATSRCQRTSRTSAHCHHGLLRQGLNYSVLVFLYNTTYLP